MFLRSVLAAGGTLTIYGISIIIVFVCLSYDLWISWLILNSIGKIALTEGSSSFYTFTSDLWPIFELPLQISVIYMTYIYVMAHWGEC